MRKMRKDQTQTEKRVVGSRRRRISTQKAHVARRQARRDRRYRNTTEHKGLQAFLRIDWARMREFMDQYAEALQSFTERFAEGFQRAMVTRPRFEGKTYAQKMFDPEEIASLREAYARKQAVWKTSDIVGPAETGPREAQFEQAARVVNRPSISQSIGKV